MMIAKFKEISTPPPSYGFALRLSVPLKIKIKESALQFDSLTNYASSVLDAFFDAFDTPHIKHAV